jgi:uncharacterized protein
MEQLEQFAGLLSKEQNLTWQQTKNTLKLISEGNTVPFMARYRKEATGSLDEVAITTLRDRFYQLKELEKRKESILKSIGEQGKLTESLKQQVTAATTLAEAEDIYLPYKPKRKTRAVMAKEKGLEPLAMKLLKKNLSHPEEEALSFVNENKGVASVEEALQGARDIIAEQVNEHKFVRKTLRRFYHYYSRLSSSVVKGKEADGQKYESYFDFEEPVSDMPSHRILAMLRGENEGFLRLKVVVDEEDALGEIINIFLKSHHTQEQVLKAIADAYNRLLHPSMENDMKAVLKEKADGKAIEVFAQNARQLLLAPPLGQKNIMAIDPGFRTGCKVVCLDKNGNLLHNETIYPHPPHQDIKTSAKKIKHLASAYKIEAIAIGNGTAGRETEQFIRKVRFDKDLIAVMVNESGASVYSASSVARKEFPDYDVTVRGAVSIGRRLMDPLSELVKIDPKSIGVGQYQHDVNQKELNQKLKDMVESCVNAVGVDVNTASEELLTHVSGIGPVLAEKIVEYRKEHGSFHSRNELKMVERFGEKAFEQSAGFLRIPESENPLDQSSVHPESYHVVEKMARTLKATVTDLMSKAELRQKLDLNQFVTDQIQMPTLQDIMKELEKPGRDPRESFDLVQFDNQIHHIEQLKSGMTLPGIVTNITDFGAFVDIGVHQDGLVHISELANKYVKNPNDIVSLNQKVTVKVLSVDIPRKRIQLSMK